MKIVGSQGSNEGVRERSRGAGCRRRAGALRCPAGAPVRRSRCRSCDTLGPDLAVGRASHL